MSQRYSVWSLDRSGQWLEVTSGTKEVMEASAARKNTLAQSNGIDDAEYVVTPTAEPPAPRPRA